MKENTMTHDWRTVQLFIGDNGISEVEVDSLNSKNVRCTCTGSAATGRCPHVKYVKNTMLKNDGHYTVSIPVELDEEEVEIAMKTAESFREFIIRYGKVEVL